MPSKAVSFFPRLVPLQWQIATADAGWAWDLGVLSSLVSSSFSISGVLNETGFHRLIGSGTILKN